MSHKSHGTQHHIIPKSRGGPKNESWNIIEKNSKEHRAWHIIFYNLLPCEALHKTKTNCKFKYNNLKKKHKKSWQILFGENASSKQAGEIIKRDWILPWCFRFKECFDFTNSKKNCPILELYEKGELKW